MQLKTRGMVVLILGIFWGIIGLSMVAGTWQTKVGTSDVVVESPDDIKGWMTLADVSAYFKIPVEELVKVLGLPSDVETDMPLKEIAEENGKEVDDLRGILKEHLGIAKTAGSTTTHVQEPGEGPGEANTEDRAGETGIPASQSGQSNTTVNQSGETGTGAGQASEKAAVGETGSDSAAPVKTGDAVETPAQHEGGSGENQTITGRMTLKETETVTKVPASYICEKLKIPGDVDKNTALRDLARQYNFEVDKVREIVAGYKP